MPRATRAAALAALLFAGDVAAFSLRLPAQQRAPPRSKTLIQAHSGRRAAFAAAATALTTGLKARREGQMTQDAAGPPGQKPRSPLYLPGPARRELAKIVGFDAAGGPHRCLDDADPLESCACFFRIAHEGA